MVIQVCIPAPLLVEITDDKKVNMSSVYKDCVLEISNKEFLINLIQLPMKGVGVIMCMDWLGKHHALIDYEQQ